MDVQNVGKHTVRRKHWVVIYALIVERVLHLHAKCVLENLSMDTYY